jgi:hypothetical protein
VNTILEFSTSDVAPNRDAVFENQGIPPGSDVKSHIEALYHQAGDVFAETAAPVGLLQEIATDEFTSVYHGEGRNEPDTPVGDIFHRADHLALFVVTLGKRTGDEIGRRFESNDFAFACMLDATASVAADNAADMVERRFGVTLDAKGWGNMSKGVLRYSPGYCGWHISGQRRLFDVLQPERIGVTLRDSFLMEPLKSVSGVIVAGPREIHNFPITYGFCSQCETRSCRQRLKGLYAD